MKRWFIAKTTTFLSTAFRVVHHKHHHPPVVPPQLRSSSGGAYAIGVCSSSGGGGGGGINGINSRCYSRMATTTMTTTKNVIPTLQVLLSSQWSGGLIQPRSTTTTMSSLHRTFAVIGRGGGGGGNGDAENSIIVDPTATVSTESQQEHAQTQSSSTSTTTTTTTDYTVLSQPALGSPFHYAFPVHDLQLAKEFYGTILGCVEGRSSTKWQDYSLHGHQIVAHYVGTEYRCIDYYNPVDGDEVPVPHTGLALTVDQFHELANRLRKFGIQFIIEPHLRFQGMPGEQYTMFFKDPSGNNLEFKAMTHPENLFAKYNVVDH